MPIYCGNNKMNRRLLNNEVEIGSRSKCLKKGFGIGINKPIDLDYLGEYEPIYIDKFFCGDDENDAPNDYRMGTLPQCLQRGVAIGKLQKAQNNDSGDNFSNELDSEHNFILKITLILFIDIIYILIIMYLKPKFFLNKMRYFDNRKIILSVLGITVFLFILLLYFFKI